MNRIVRRTHRGVPVVRIEGELGLERAQDFRRVLREARGDRIVVDLRKASHLHYRMATELLELARRRRVELVGPSPYLREILRFVGGADGVLPEFRTLREALEAHDAA
ncbi:STAS domain-containing protein [Deferrisoma palaeochoriense]